MYKMEEIYYFDDFFCRLLYKGYPPYPFGVFPLTNAPLLLDEDYTKYLASLPIDDDSYKDNDPYYWECLKLYEDALFRMHYFIMSNAGKLLYIPSGVFFKPIPTEQFFYDMCEVNLMTVDEAFNLCLKNPTLRYTFYGFTTSRYPQITSQSEKFLPVYLCSWVAFFYDCCYPDFSPIVRILGGSPSPVQLENLKSICHLLGVDTAENGLKDCELMKDYLKRLNQILGGSPYLEPNDNLKSICYLLGVYSAENGLKDCELSKDYVKRISKMLGAE